MTAGLYATANTSPVTQDVGATDDALSMLSAIDDNDGSESLVLMLGVSVIGDTEDIGSSPSVTGDNVAVEETPSVVEAGASSRSVVSMTGRVFMTEGAGGSLSGTGDSVGVEGTSSVLGATVGLSSMVSVIEGTIFVEGRLIGPKDTKLPVVTAVPL